MATPVFSHSADGYVEKRPWQRHLRRQLLQVEAKAGRLVAKVVASGPAPLFIALRKEGRSRVAKEAPSTVPKEPPIVARQV